MDFIFIENITKLAIIGSRTFNDPFRMEMEVNKLRTIYPDINLIISGGAKGADKLGEQYAKNHNIRTLIIQPDWKTYGKAAGVLRNTDIIKEADVVIAFWDGKSKGTADSIKKAKDFNKIIIVINFEINCKNII